MQTISTFLFVIIAQVALINTAAIPASMEITEGKRMKLGQ
jgi:hypothetical protein